MARLLSRMLVIILGLSVRLVTAQQVAKRTAANANADPKTTGTPTATSFSSTDGPFIAANYYSWSQYITPTTVGTVLVTVNEATNQTWSTTIYHSEFLNNGSMSILTRTDTDAAGTVTGVVKDEHGKNTTMTYPTNFFEAADSMTWAAVVPITTPGDYIQAMTDVVGTLTTLDFPGVGINTVNGTCCLQSFILSPTPSHVPFTQTGSINTEDLRGWLYTLIGFDLGDPAEQLGPSQVSSLWAHQSLGIQYTGCPHTICNVTSIPGVAAASAVAAQGNILATSTTTISSDASTSPSPAGKASPAAKASPTATISPTTNVSAPAAKVSKTAESSSPSPKTSKEKSDTPGISPSQTTKAENAPPETTPLRPQKASTTSTSSTPKSNPSDRTTLDSSLVEQSTTPDATTLDSPIVAQSPSSNPGSPNTNGKGSSVQSAAGHTSDSHAMAQSGTAASTQLGSSVSVTTPNSLHSSVAPIVIAEITIAPGSSSDYIVSSQTLQAGSSITLVSGSSTRVVAMQISSSHTILKVDSSSFTMSQQQTSPPALTIDSSVVSANSASEYVIAGQTLAPGSGIVVSGTTFTDLGGFIWVGLGGPGGSASTSMDQATASNRADSNATPSSTAPVDQATSSNRAESSPVPLSTTSTIHSAISSTEALTAAVSSPITSQSPVSASLSSLSAGERESVSVKTAILMLVLLCIAGL